MTISAAAATALKLAQLAVNGRAKRQVRGKIANYALSGRVKPHRPHTPYHIPTTTYNDITLVTTHAAARGSEAATASLDPAAVAAIYHIHTVEL